MVGENTGLYHRLRRQYAALLGVALCIENADQLRWSLGIAHAKSDKADNRPLALYALNHQGRLKPTPALQKSVVPLKNLMTVRIKPLVQIKGITTAMKELEGIRVAKAFVKDTDKFLQPTLKGMKQSLKAIEKQIKDIIQKDEVIQPIYKRLLTVPGIGHITAAYFTCLSNAFTMCMSGKQLACYCGGVPFDYQSGISIKGGREVYKMGNKELKAPPAHVCVDVHQKRGGVQRLLSAQKKCKQALSILNAIKNKLVLRAFAVV